MIILWRICYTVVCFKLIFEFRESHIFVKRKKYLKKVILVKRTSIQYSMNNEKQTRDHNEHPSEKYSDFNFVHFWKKSKEDPHCFDFEWQFLIISKKQAWHHQYSCVRDPILYCISFFKYVFICLLFKFRLRKFGKKKLRRDDDDYENECRFHSDFDKEIVLTVHLTLDADLDPNFIFPRAPANTKGSVQFPLSGTIVGYTTRITSKFWCGIRALRAETITVLSPTTSVNLDISSVFKKMSVLPTTRHSITGSTSSPFITARSCSTRTRLSVTSRQIRSWYLQKNVPKGLLRA